MTDVPQHDQRPPGPPPGPATGPITGSLPVLTGPPLIVRRAAFTLVLLLVAASVVVTVLATVAAGGYVLASALFIGAAARALLPEYLCLGLLVRSRRQDAITLLVLGVAVAVGAGVLPEPT